MLQSRNHGAQDGCQAHPDQKRLEPPASILNQNVVDKDLGKSRYYDARNDEREAHQDQQSDCGFRTPQLLEQDRQCARPSPYPLELRARLHGQDDAGECLIQLRHVDLAAAYRGVVDEGGFSTDPFEDHKVIEVPMNNAGHRQLVELGRLFAEASGAKSKSSRRLYDVARVAAVSRHPACHSQLLERNPCSVVCEDDSQCRGPAFDRFHLKDRGRPRYGSAGEQSAPARRGCIWHGVSHFRSEVEPRGIYPVIPVKRLKIGTTRSIGCRFRVVISARVRVPLVRRSCGPVPTAHRYPVEVRSSCSSCTTAAYGAPSREKRVTRLSLRSSASMPCGVMGNSEMETTVPTKVPNSSRLTVLGSRRTSIPGLTLFPRSAGTYTRASRVVFSVLIPITGVPTERTEPVDTLTSITRPSIGLAISVFRPSSPASCSICRLASLRRNLGVFAIFRALRLQIKLLRSELQYLVLCIFSSLLCIGELTAPVLDIAARRYPLCQQALEVFNLVGEILNALVCRSNDLLECRLELGKIPGLGG